MSVTIIKVIDPVESRKAGISHREIVPRTH